MASSMLTGVLCTIGVGAIVIVLGLLWIGRQIKEDEEQDESNTDQNKM